jgi:AGZA family xanthine/uracil permease-like MFS transporter
MIQKIKKFFDFEARGASISKELIGALCTFLALSYILAVEPAMLSATGMSQGAVFTATCIVSALATIFMGVFANLPIAISTGMGLNATMVYGLCLGMGYSWQTALAMFFIEGIIALILAFTNVRKIIIDAIPECLRKAIPVAIGLFITLVGLASAGVLTNQGGTLIGLGNIKGGTGLVALIGIAITFGLAALKVPGSILIGIILTTIVGIPFGVTLIPENWSFFSKPEAPYFGAMFGGFSGIFDLGILTAIATILTLTLSDVFDTLGTAFGVGRSANLLDKDDNLPKVRQMFIADSSGTIFGGLFGTSSATSYIESGAGVSAGAKTGLSSVFIGLLFIVALFFSNVFLLVPAAATAGALFYVGWLMMQGASEIDFTKIETGIPAFTTITMMAFAYSITEGIIYGLIAYVICMLFSKKVKEITIPVWILFAIFIARFFIG